MEIKCIAITIGWWYSGLLKISKGQTENITNKKITNMVEDKIHTKKQ